MGSGKQGKKIKKHSREPVENVQVVRDFDNDDTHPITGMNEGDVAEANMKLYKSKKVRKNNSKDDPSSSEPNIAVNDVGDSFRKEKKRSKKIFEEKDGHSTNKKTKSAKKKVQEVTISDVPKSKKARKNKSRYNPSSSVPSIAVNDADDSCKEEKRKSKVCKEKDALSTNKNINPAKEVQKVTMPDVYEIPSGEEDTSEGMKKWIKEFHERRPGLKVLQDQIDEFITAHEEQEEQQRREREAKLSEEGWTVVVHRKGGKRTTDAESGVAVGSVAEAAVREKIAKKKNKEFGLDFYRFQRKEAHRSEIMKLQSKFEEDKMRIQQIRAARKFKPY